MNGEYLLMFGIPLAAFMASLFSTFWLAKWRNKIGLTCFDLLWVGFTGVMFIGIDTASGWDGLGYMLGLIGISAPIGAAALIGGTVGWFKREKAMHA